MAANDGPVPVRTLAHAARLLRDAGQLHRYGIRVSEPALEFPRLLERVREVVVDARQHSSFRELIDKLGVPFTNTREARASRIRKPSEREAGCG
jgi:pyruvate/2-oxoglutarate dehydrogenase complex dihydrolipoamide dehydrogenase (E3) component